MQFSAIGNCMKNYWFLSKEKNLFQIPTYCLWNTCVFSKLFVFDPTVSYSIELSGTTCSSFFSEIRFRRFHSDHNHLHASQKRVKWFQKKHNNSDIL